MAKKKISRISMETCLKILQLKFEQHQTNRTIALTLNISPSTVSDVLSRFKNTSISWPLPESMTTQRLEVLIFPGKQAPEMTPALPDWLYIDTELRRVGVTRQLLWMEYKHQAGEYALGY